MAQNKTILLHACCGICSAYPIEYLLKNSFLPIIYFSNSNLDTEFEFEARLEAQKKICKHFKVELFAESYNHNEYINYIKGLEQEPEKGLRCNKCIEYRLIKAARKTKEIGINIFATSLVISPHKNYNLITEIGEKIAKENNLQYLAVNFRKNDGYLKTNKIAKKLDIYRQKYCGCEFAKNI